MDYLSFVSFSILFNGEMSYFYRPSMGIRKGFPLVSLLFLLVAKGLRRAYYQQEFQEVLKMCVLGDASSLHLSYFLMTLLSFVMVK